MADKKSETWGTGDAYEQYVGRWSKPAAREFLTWLEAAPGLRWGDIGSGTGAVVEAILATYNPSSVIAMDRSEGYINDLQERVIDPRVHLSLGNAITLPWINDSFGATVSGLVLNFVPDPMIMLREMVRVTQPGGTVGVYVWDYADGMQMMRYFWDAATEINPQDSDLDEAERFSICQPGPLEALFWESGLIQVSAGSLVIPTIFKDFDDYWVPFLGKQGPAPTYLASLSDERRDQIRYRLEALLPKRADGSIALTARAWAAQGKVK